MLNNSFFVVNCKNKFFVIFLLFLFVCSLGSVVACEDVVFEQGLNDNFVVGEMVSGVGDDCVFSKKDDLRADFHLSGGSFSDIQDAIFDAGDGDIIFLDGKTYTGNGSAISVTKNITLVGGSSLNDDSYATLDAKFLSNIITVNAPITIKGIIFVNGNFSGGGAMHVYGNSTVVDNCTFINNHAGNGGAVYSSGMNLKVYGCEFVNNDADSGSVIFSDFGDSYFYDCIFKDNRANVNSLDCVVYLDSYFDDRNAIVDIFFGGGDNPVLKGFHVSKESSISLINAYCVENGKTTKVSSKITPCPVEGNVSFCLNGVEIFSKDNVDGNIIVPLIDVDSGYYTLGLVVENRGSVVSFERKGYFIPPVDCGMFVVIPDGVAEGECVDFMVVLPDDATGNVTFTINGQKYNRKIIPGQNIVFPVSNLVSGEYIFEAYYSGDDKYWSCVDNGYVTVTSIGIRVNSTDVTVVLPSHLTGNISISADNQTIYNSSINNCLIVIPHDFVPGYHNIVVLVDDNGTRIMENKMVFVPKINPIMFFDVPDHAYEGQSVSIKVTLPFDAKGNITFVIDGETRVVQVMGRETTIQVSNLNKAKHVLTAIYSGDDKYDSSSIRKVIAIERLGIGTYIEVEKDFTRVSTDFNGGERGDYFYSVLKDGDGNLLVNKSVQVGVNGPIYTVKTDSQGCAAIMINLASANTYTYALVFSGDGEYNAAPLACSKLVVTKKPITISASAHTFAASAKTKTVTVTLKTSKNPYDGKTYLNKGKKVTITVNGKTYSGSIDGNGVAKINIGALIKKGTYNAVINFAGDNTYSSASKTIKITLK